MSALGGRFAGAAPRLGAWPARPASPLANERLERFLPAVLGLALFVPLVRPWFWLTTLDPAVYARPVVALAGLAQPRAWPAALMVLALVVFGARVAWRDFALAPQIRCFMAALALAMAWAFATTEFNYVYGRWHEIDRVLLVALAGLGLWRPVWLAVFALELFLVAGQFHFPLLYSWTDKLPLLEAFVLFQVFLALALLQRRTRLRVAGPAVFESFLMAMLMLLAMYYVKPALGKLALGWLWSDELGNLHRSAAFQNGWLATLGSERGLALHAAIVRAGPLLKLGTLSIELGLLFVLARRWLAVALLLAAAGMHAGVFASSGIFFWKWMIADLVLAGIVAGLGRETASRLFHPALAAAGAVVVVAALFVHGGPVRLAWYDAPMTYRFHIEAVGESGTTYQVPPRALAPYDLPFAQARFYFLTETPRLAGTLAAVFDEELQHALEQAALRPELAPEVRRRHGQRVFDARAADRLEGMLRLYFASRARGDTRLPIPAAPQHIWSFPTPGLGQPEFRAQEPIARVRIRLLEWLLRPDGSAIEIGDAVVRDFALSAAAG